MTIESVRNSVFELVWWAGVSQHSSVMGNAPWDRAKVYGTTLQHSLPCRYPAVSKAPRTAAFGR